MRVAFIIDGFNLYHSAKAAALSGGVGTKWLDLRSLCSSYLHLLDRSAVLADVYYFSALASHIEAFKPDVTERHRTYIQVLEGTGVRVELARFKPKDVSCPNCNWRFRRYEEKETDVAIAAKLLELFAAENIDAAVLVTGDTDVAPAVRAAARLYPMKRVCFAFPFARKNKELAKLVPTCFVISKEAYAKHQFPDPVALSDGTIIAKPPSW